MDQQPPPTPAGPTGPVGVVEEARRVLAELTETLWAARTPEELVGVIHQLEAMRSQVAGLEASVVTEVEARGIAKNTLAWGSTGDWFTHTAGTQRSSGHRTARQAPALVRERTATHTALGRGEISPEQASVIVDAVDTLPHDPDLRARAERVLLDEATRLDATALATVGRKIAAVVDPDREDRKAEAALEREERAAHHHRFLAITPDGGGGVWLKGRGTAEDAALIKAALLPLTKPTPAVDPAGDPQHPEEERLVDPRDHGARLWDALVAACQHALDTELPPESHGAKPRLAVTTDLDSLRDQLGHADPPPAPEPNRTGGSAAERIDWATLGHQEPGGLAAGVLDGYRRPGGVTEDGAHLSPATVRRLACDADLIPVALGTQGQVLDVGRARRLVTPAIWTALVCRDQHCTFPGCTRPPLMCHAHHIIHWADHGTTALANLALLCGHHHRTIHDTPWEVRLNASDGRPEFKPPPRRGTEQDWIRSRPRRE